MLLANFATIYETVTCAFDDGQDVMVFRAELIVVSWGKKLAGSSMELTLARWKRAMT
jgi:hypothetical protein